MLRKLLVPVLLFSTAGICNANWFTDAIKEATEAVGRKSVQDAGESTYQGTKEEIRDAINKRKNQSGQQPAPQQGGDPAYQQQQQQQQQPPLQQGGDPGYQQQTLPPPSMPDQAGSGEEIYSKYDFVPGDKVLFYDDFSDTDLGEFPRKWHLKGPKAGNNNAVEVVDFQGKRLLRSQPASADANQYLSTQYIRLNKKGDLPVKFTIEFDAYFTTRVNDDYSTLYELFLLNDDTTWPGLNAQPSEGIFIFSGIGGQSKNTKTALNMNDKKLHRISVSVNDTFVKAYVDNVRVINDPDGVIRPIKMIGISMGVSGDLQSDKVMIGNFRLAEGGKDIKSALDTDGKIVTHGILFDTGKDTIKPESQPTLKMILRILNDDQELKFSIEGHTDNQGGKGINQPLSERRAVSVKNWLVEKGIDSARLKTKGFGDTKPIDSNKTLEGRANNRRVEFVKF